MKVGVLYKYTSVSISQTLLYYAGKPSVYCQANE